MNCLNRTSNLKMTELNLGKIAYPATQTGFLCETPALRAKKSNLGTNSSPTEQIHQKAAKNQPPSMTEPFWTISLTAKKVNLTFRASQPAGHSLGSWDYHASNMASKRKVTVK